MKDQLTADRSDALLFPFLQAADEATSERLLSEALEMASDLRAMLIADLLAASCVFLGWKVMAIERCD